MTILNPARSIAITLTTLTALTLGACQPTSYSSSPQVAMQDDAAPVALSAHADETPLLAPSLRNFRDLSASPMTGKSGKSAAERVGVLTFNMEHRDRPQELQIMADRLRSDL